MDEGRRWREGELSEVSAALVSSVELFSGLDPGELEGLLRIFQRVAFSAGAGIVRQGQPADSAVILESGTAEVITELPGGGEAKVAELGPGSVLGEMALLEGGVRSATVIARKPVTGYVVERDSFRMLLAQRDRAALTIRGRILRALCRRLRELNARIVASNPPESTAPPLSGQMADPAGIRRGKCSFDFRAFLPMLPFFRRFRKAELEEFVRQADVLELERGQILFQQGDSSATCFVVVRGALEIAHAENGRRHRIGVLGPGRLCGMIALVDGEPHSTSAAARENTTLLEIPKALFDRLFSGSDAVAARFQDALNRELVQSLARANNHLTRLISQARIRGSRLKDKEVKELQRALGTQDCRTA